MKSLGALVEFLQFHRRGRAPAQILRHQLQVVRAGLGPLAVRTDVARLVTPWFRERGISRSGAAVSRCCYRARTGGNPANRSSPPRSIWVRMDGRAAPDGGEEAQVD